MSAESWEDDYLPPLEDDSWLWTDADEVRFAGKPEEMPL